MRLIDAEALINELNNSRYPGAPYVDVGISIAIGKVCDAPTIESQMWTPCSERLPEKPDTYTVTDSKGDVVRFVFDDSASSREYWLRCAKAWMPLPKPYKEDKMDDLISRQAAIDALQHIDMSTLPYKNVREYEDAPILEMRKLLEKLPSAQTEAQPEIIRCKDCKHWFINKRLCSRLHIDRGADDFCSFAERKTDG